MTFLLAALLSLHSGHKGLASLMFECVNINSCRGIPCPQQIDLRPAGNGYIFFGIKCVQPSSYPLHAQHPSVRLKYWCVCFTEPVRAIHSPLLVVPTSRLGWGEGQRGTGRVYPGCASRVKFPSCLNLSYYFFIFSLKKYI